MGRSSAGRPRRCARSGNGTRRSASRRQSTSENALQSMTQSAEAPPLGRPRALGESVPRRARALDLARSRGDRRPHERLPPAPADGLAAARGRDARALRRPRLARGVVEHVTRERGGAPLHFLLAWGVAHLGVGLGALRLVSVVFALGSLPLVALLGRRLAGRRDGARRDRARRGELALPLPRRLRAHVQPLPLPLRGLSAAPAARPRRPPSRLGLVGDGEPARRRGASLRRARARRAGALRARRAARPAAPAAYAFGAVLLLGIPFWLTDLVLAGRFDVGVGGGGETARRPGAVATYLWHTAGDFSAGWCACARRRAAARRCRARARVARDAAAGARDRRRAGRGVPARTCRRLDLPGVATPHLRGAAVRRRRGDRGSGARRRRTGGRRRRGRHAARGRGRAGRGIAPRPCSLGAGQASGRPRARRRRTSPPPAGPTTCCSATSRSSSAPGSATTASRASFVPRADPRLALRTLERQPQPLGRGVWVLDASDTNNLPARSRSRLSRPSRPRRS